MGFKKDQIVASKATGAEFVVALDQRGGRVALVPRKIDHRGEYGLWKDAIDLELVVAPDEEAFFGEESLDLEVGDEPEEGEEVAIVTGTDGAQALMGRAMYYDNTSAGRKETPIFRGVMRYAPAALALVSKLSMFGNRKHNPGATELTHARNKSSDHGDCIARHQCEVGTIDPDSDLDHAVGVAWRALMQLQELAEKKYGWPVAPAAKFGDDK